MNTMSKIAIISASVLTMGALTACQTTTAPQEKKQYKKDHMSAEMREKRQAHKAERKAYAEQAQKACDGKAVGQAVQIKVADKVIDGSCTIHFKADRKEMKQARADQRPMRAEMRGLDQTRALGRSGTEVMTDAQRAELTKQFDQRLANRQAKQQAFLKACEGQTHGKTVQIKLDEKSINGQCQVRFQPKMLKANPATKTA